MIRHIAGFGEIVEDVDAAAAFYRDVLGLTVEHEDGTPYANVVVPGVLHFGLWQRAAAAESLFGDPRATDQVPLGFALGFEVDDVDAACAAATERGLTLVQPPQMEPWGQKTARFFLPSGLVGEFSETPWAREVPASS